MPAPASGVYLDWNESLPTLEAARAAGLFALVIGPKGTGKTTLVRRASPTRPPPRWTR